MDPVTTAIVAAVAAGAADSENAAASQAVKDAYASLKTLILQKYGDEIDLKRLEERPESKSRQAFIAEELTKVQADQDEEVLKVAQRVLTLLEPQNNKAVAGGDITISGRDIKISEVHYHQVVSLSDIDDEDLRFSYKKLEEQIETYMGAIAETLIDKPNLQDEALTHLRIAREILRELGEDPAWTLSRAQFEIHRVHSIIVREQVTQSNERKWRWTVPSLILIYIALIIVVIAFGSNIWTSTTEVPIIGVPVGVLVWAAIGSLSAILYRFYTQPRGNIKTQLEWLIARPIIGIIMGALSFIVIVSGLFIFSTATGIDMSSQVARPQLLWVLAFLGGFSDKFFEAIIENVVGKVTNSKFDNTPSRQKIVGTELEKNTGHSSTALPKPNNNANQADA